jgi:hypothetical protein
MQKSTIQSKKTPNRQKPSATKRVLAVFLLLAIVGGPLSMVLLALGMGMPSLPSLDLNLGLGGLRLPSLGTSIKDAEGTSPTTKAAIGAGYINGSLSFLETEPSAPNTDGTITLGEKIGERIAKQSSLPPGRTDRVNIDWFEDNKLTNQKAIDHLLEELAGEIGSSETLGILRTMRENKASDEVARQLEKSADPETAASAREERSRLAQENTILLAKLTESYHKEGFPFTEAQVASMVRSPHGEETASLISGFQNIRAICLKMEERLRLSPTEEQARRYYGTYHVLLKALDIIQRNAIKKIEAVHIPGTRWVHDEADKTMREAADILQGAADHDKNLSQGLVNPTLSPNQKDALRFNMESCVRTKKTAKETEAKLQEAREILVKSNAKLQFAIRTASNSQTAMMLHTEITRIGEDHQREIDALQNLTVPQMVAADFSDPSAPWLSPAADESHLR